MLERWPENPALLSMRIVIKRIMAFKADSPLLKVLTGLEMLVARSYEWEEYASREMSVKACIDDIVSTIVSWRKIELASWKNLLGA